MWEIRRDMRKIKRKYEEMKKKYERWDLEKFRFLPSKRGAET